VTTYYVGIGGNDGNTGLSWAQRFLTLNAAEDEPVASGDTVYVGPGTYREMLTVDIDGASMITYIGDVSGENTDGVGGIVRVTGSDNDTSANRAYCITATSKDYRTFRGFTFDGAATACVYADSCTDWVIEDFGISPQQDNDYGMHLSGTYDTVTIRRGCILGADTGIRITNAGDVSATSFTIENVIVTACGVYGIYIQNVDTITIKNCTITGNTYGVYTTSLAAETDVDVLNCIVQGNYNGLYAAAADQIYENYNALFGNDTDTTNCNSGGNSNNYMPLFLTPILLAAYRYPWSFGALSEYSQLSAITGSAASSDDFYGITRPTTASKKGWGAVQFSDAERETGTTHGGSTASYALHDAGEVQIWLPTTNTEITIAVQVYREANYAGVNPRLVIKQPGEADDTTTDGAAASQWNELTTTLTPSADTDYVVICLQSLNTAVAGNYDTFFDTLTVT
jgi:parallel beta-helix repeat protein